MRALLLILLLLPGCKRGLEPEMARKILVDKLWSGDGAKRFCGWHGLARMADKEWAFSEGDAKCAQALQAAGLASVGGCVDQLRGRCWKTAITAQGGAYIDEHTLWFTCGSIGLPDVKSVTTDGARATVVYERAGQIDEGLLAKLASCPLSRPNDTGKMERTKHFLRDDAGVWQLMDK